MSLLVVLGLKKFIPPAKKTKAQIRREEKAAKPIADKNTFPNAAAFAKYNQDAVQQKIDQYREAFKSFGGKATTAQIGEKTNQLQRSVCRFAKKHPELIARTGEYVGKMQLLCWIEDKLN